MDDTFDECQNYGRDPNDLQNELDEWFLVSGDTDDFIFFGENDRFHSEK